MIQNLFTLSERGKSGEYTASVVKVHNLRPIEGSDFLALASAAGEDVIVRKDEVKEGDIMVYVRIETVLDLTFLGSNNLFDPDNYSMNSNAEEYLKVREEKGKDEARKLCGYFNKTGRVRIARLRGVPSKGFLFGKEALVKWKPELFSDVNLEDYLDIPCFDTIDGKTFVKVYIPYSPDQKVKKSKDRDRKLAKFDRILPEYFHFHYDTKQLTMMMPSLNPDFVVSISVKLHGTSAIFGNVLTKCPIYRSPVVRAFDKIRQTKIKKLGYLSRRARTESEKEYLIERKKRLMKKIHKKFVIVYADIYASRTVIKNQYINREANKRSYYRTDVWGSYEKLLKGKIEKGTTIYGEIIGYEEGLSKTIQKGYDYGCDPGTSKLMIYRVVHQDPEGKTVELDIPDVLEYTKKLIKKYPELKDKIHPIDILYNGKLGNLYPDLDTNSETWNDDVLQRLKEEPRFGLEVGNREPLCKTKVPREGIVVRVDGDTSFCAKLKSLDFQFRDAKNYDKGEIDRETALQI